MTAMNENLLPDVLKMFVAKIPLGRAGQPVDIARAILCFIQEDLFITGQTIVVDGGSTMH
jgi:NAD(P)-dependent dehydrogenase (short-subunit alcohol dehydrogenase family)